MSQRVLLVDDEEEFVETLAERMRSRGMAVAAETSGKEALERIAEEPFDVVVLDLLMPEMDGLEVLAAIKRSKPDIQVILLTGHATVKKSIEAIKGGAMDMIEKPVDIEDLAAVIRDAEATKMVLVEKETEDKIRDILGHMGW